MKDNILNLIRKQRFVVGLLLIATVLFLWMIKAYIIPLILAVVTTGLMMKPYDKLVERTKGKKALSATVIVITVLLLIILPLGGFLSVVIDEAIQISQTVAGNIQSEVSKSNGVFNFPDWLPMSDWLNSNKDAVLKRLNEIAGKLGESVVNRFANFAGSALNMVLQLFIYLYALFYFVMDRKKIVQRIKDFLPLKSNEIDFILQQGVSVTRATLKGALLIGIIQGSLVGLAFAVLGIQGAAFWGAISIALSIIPSVGSGLVWVPAAIILMAQGHRAEAIGLALWGILVVGTIDNFLRPKLVGRDAKMGDLTIFLSTLGGIGLFGITGFILGPVLAGLTQTAWLLYEQEVIKPEQEGFDLDDYLEQDDDNDGEEETKDTKQEVQKE